MPRRYSTQMYLYFLPMGVKETRSPSSSDASISRAFFVHGTIKSVVSTIITIFVVVFVVDRE